MSALQLRPICAELNEFAVNATLSNAQLLAIKCIFKRARGRRGQIAAVALVYVCETAKNKGRLHTKHKSIFLSFRVLFV